MHQWINGEAINDFFAHLQTTGAREDLVFASSYVYETARRRAREGDVVRLRRLSSKLAGKRRWILPLHFDSHWCLCAVDLERRILFFYEPMAGEDSRWECFSDDMSEAALILGESLQAHHPGPWLSSMGCYATPQRDGVSCGVYVMLTGQILHEIDGVPDFIAIRRLETQRKRILGRSKLTAEEKKITWTEIRPSAPQDAVVRDPMMEFCDEIAVLSTDRKMGLIWDALETKRRALPFGISREFRFFLLEDADGEYDAHVTLADIDGVPEQVWIESSSSRFTTLAFERELLLGLLERGTREVVVCLAGFFRLAWKEGGIVHSEDYHHDDSIFRGENSDLKMLVNDVLFSFANYFPGDFLTLLLAKDRKEAEEARKRTERDFFDVRAVREGEEDVFVELGNGAATVPAKMRRITTKRKRRVEEHKAGNIIRAIL